MNYTRNDIIKEVEKNIGKLYQGANSYRSYSHLIKNKEKELGITPLKYKNKDDFEYCIYDYDEYKAIVDSMIEKYRIKNTELLISTNEIKENAKQRGIKTSLSSSVTNACRNLNISPKEVISNMHYFSTDDAEKILDWIMLHCGKNKKDTLRKRYDTQNTDIIKELRDENRRLREDNRKLIKMLDEKPKGLFGKLFRR